MIFLGDGVLSKESLIKSSHVEEVDVGHVGQLTKELRNLLSLNVKPLFVPDDTPILFHHTDDIWLFTGVNIFAEEGQRDNLRHEVPKVLLESG